MSLFLLNLLLTCCGVLGEMTSLSGPPYPSDDILTELSDVPSPFVSTIDGSYPNEEVVEFIPAFLPFRGTVKPTPSDEFLEDLLEFFSSSMVDPGDPGLVFFSSTHQETGHPIRTGSIVPGNRSLSVLPYPRTSPVKHDRVIRDPSRKLETAEELIPRGSKQSSTAFQTFGAATSDATPLKRLMCITLLQPVRLQQPDPRSSNNRQKSSTTPVIQAVTSYYWYGKGKRKRCPKTQAKGSEHRSNKNSDKIKSPSLTQTSRDQASHLKQSPPRRKNIALLKPPPMPPRGVTILKPPPTPPHHHSAHKPHPNHGHPLKPSPTAAKSSTPEASSSLPSGVELVNVTAIYGSSGSNCTCLPVDRCPEGRGRKAARCGRTHVCCPNELLLHTKCGVLEHEARKGKSPGVGPLSAPWAATILLKTPSGYAFVCGGALIHPRAILTDASCVRRLHEDALVVRLGEGLELGSERPSTYQEIPVLKKMSRLDELNVPRRKQEVALLFLRRSARLRPGLSAVCLRSIAPPATACHVATYKTFITGAAVTRGWRPSPGCRRVLSAFSGVPPVSADTPCAVCPELSPSGHGKTGQVSGAPVSCPDPRSGRHRLVGIVAWSDKRGGTGHPMEFIRLHPFYRWIENHVTRYFRYHHPYFGQLQE